MIGYEEGERFRLGALADDIEGEVVRHRTAFGPDHGIDRLIIVRGDLTELSPLLEYVGLDLHEGVLLAWSAVEPVGGVVLPIPAALVVGQSLAELSWYDQEPVEFRTHRPRFEVESGLATVMELRRGGEDELSHKLLSALGAVPYRDAGGDYDIDWTARPPSKVCRTA